MSLRMRFLAVIASTAVALSIGLLVVLYAVPNHTPHHFGLYVDTDVGLANAGGSLEDPGLRYAQEAGFDTVIGYDLFQASPDGVRHYLDAARQLGLQVILNLQDWRATTDATVRTAYDKYGFTPGEWASTILRDFANHPAVGGVNITDEYPEDPSTAGDWQAALRARQALVRHYTPKPIMLTLFWPNLAQDERRSFFRRVLSAGDELAIDYYPIPEQPRYGAVSNVDALAGDLKAVNTGRGWFVAQAFAWSSPNNLRVGQSLGFPPDALSPTVDQMVDMAQRALRHGAQHVMFYSYTDMTDQQRQNLREAMRRLRA